MTANPTTPSDRMARHLNEFERMLVAFELRRPDHTEAKEDEISLVLGLTVREYYGALARILSVQTLTVDDTSLIREVRSRALGRLDAAVGRLFG